MKSKTNNSQKVKNPFSVNIISQPEKIMKYPQSNKQKAESAREREKTLNNYKRRTAKKKEGGG